MKLCQSRNLIVAPCSRWSIWWLSIQHTHTHNLINIQNPKQNHFELSRFVYTNPMSAIHFRVTCDSWWQLCATTISTTLITSRPQKKTTKITIFLFTSNVLVSTRDTHWITKDDEQPEQQQQQNKNYWIQRNRQIRIKPNKYIYISVNNDFVTDSVNHTERKIPLLKETTTTKINKYSNLFAITKSKRFEIE